MTLFWWRLFSLEKMLMDIGCSVNGVNNSKNCDANTYFFCIF